MFEKLIDPNDFPFSEIRLYSTVNTDEKKGPQHD